MPSPNLPHSLDERQGATRPLSSAVTRLELCRGRRTSHEVRSPRAALSPLLLLAVSLACLLSLSCTAATTWRWSNPAPHGNNIVDMATRNGLAVQVCDHGQLFTSFDFSTWFARDAHTTNDLQAVTFLGHRLVATGANGTIVYSDDGVDFTSTNLPTSDWLVGVAASSNLAVAVGDNAAIYTSRNGAVWRRLASPPPNVGANWLLSVACGPTNFVAVGEGGYIATSPNGSNWTYRSTAATITLPLTNDISRVAWLDSPTPPTGLLGDAFWAACDLGRVIYSTNGGTTWFEAPNQGASNILYTVSGNDSTRVIAGDQDLRLGWLTNGSLAWSRQMGPGSAAAPPWTYYSSIWEPTGSNYWLAGQTGMMVIGAPTNASCSWQTPFSSARDWLWSITSALDLYVAVGDHARILTSQNGANWIIEEVPATNSVSPSNTLFLGVGGDTNLLLAVGTKGSVALSSNSLVPVVLTNLGGTFVTNLTPSLGLSWTPLPPFTTNDLSGVCMFSNRYFLTGGDGAVFSTPDGATWSQLDTPVSTFLTSIDSFPGGLVAVGDNGTIITSPDGLLWTKRTSNTTNWLFRVRRLGTQFVAVGENGTILTSPTGVSWTSRWSGTTAWLNDVALVAQTNFFIVGTQGTFLTSPDAARWTPQPMITGKSLYALASQDGQLVAAGIEGIILRSQIVPDLTPPTFLSFSRAAGIDLFLVAGNPDQRFTLDSSTNFVDWVSGPALDILDPTGTLTFIYDADTNAPSPTFYRASLVLP
jgi:hypothetical protein